MKAPKRGPRNNFLGHCKGVRKKLTIAIFMPKLFMKAWEQINQIKISKTKCVRLLFILQLFLKSVDQQAKTCLKSTIKARAGSLRTIKTRYQIHKVLRHSLISENFKSFSRCLHYFLIFLCVISVIASNQNFCCFISQLKDIEKKLKLQVDIFSF